MSTAEDTSTRARCLLNELSLPFVVCLVTAAHAQPGSSAPSDVARLTDEPLPVIVSGCPPGELSGLSTILAIELDALSAQTAEWLERYRPEVRLRCDGTILDVQVVDPGSGRFIGQHLDRGSDLKSDMARWVSLTIVELIASRATIPEKKRELEPTPEEAVEASRPSQPVAPRSYPKLGLEAHFALHGGEKPFSLSVGAGLVAELAVLEYLALAVDFQYFTGKTDASIGNIRNDSFSGALFLLGRAAHGLGVVEPGVGVRVGAIVFRGAPDDSAATDGMRSAHPFGGPCLAMLSRFEVSDVLNIAVNAEVGYTLWEAAALVDGRVELAQRGVWFLLGFGIGMVPG